MLQEGDIVQNKRTKQYGTIEWSSFGFSIHSWNEVTGTLSKTLGRSEKEVLEHWEKVAMPEGYIYHKYGGIVIW